MRAQAAGEPNPERCLHCQRIMPPRSVLPFYAQGTGFCGKCAKVRLSAGQCHPTAKVYLSGFREIIRQLKNDVGCVGSWMDDEA